MKSHAFISLLLLMCMFCTTDSTRKSGIKFSISFTTEMSGQAQDGRLLLMLSNNEKNEPRFQIVDGPSTQLVFGVDVEGMKPGDEITVDETAFGYPIQSLANVPAGEYFVQALINRYETFTLKTGHTVKLPPDQSEGQQWNTKPGNFYSKPV